MKLEIRNPKSEITKRGFSLVEVTVALAIVAMVAIGVGAVLSRLPLNTRGARDQNLALSIARGEIESLRAAGYDSLPASGPFTHPLLSALPEGATSITATEYSARTKQVDVEVSWTPMGAGRTSVELTTLVTQDAGL